MVGRLRDSPGQARPGQSVAAVFALASSRCMQKSIIMYAFFISLAYLVQLNYDKRMSTLKTVLAIR